MKTYPVQISSIKNITHDVIEIVTDKPAQFSFIPGQSTIVSLKTESGGEDRGGEDKSPFSLTSVPNDDFLEFTIKTYPERDGLTDDLLDLKIGDELTLHGVFGTITYQGEGVFIAGGAGVTPFVSILRHLKETGAIGNNKLIFANKKEEDIINKEEFSQLLGPNFVNVLSEEVSDEYAHGEVTREFLQKHVDASTKHIYICGPPPMVSSVIRDLSSMGVPRESMIIEKMD